MTIQMYIANVLAILQEPNEAHWHAHFLQALHESMVTPRTIAHCISDVRNNTMIGSTYRRIQ